MKKLLALVLALVMTLGLATVSSSADYSDEADVSLNEAVDVMSAVGVFQGADGKFSPKANLNREQAAKLIAYLDLGETAAEALPAVKVFSDVPATSWSAKYIAYCADAGYIAGDGTGKFNPTGELNGYAFGKMILCVLGYDANIEGFTGNTWSINVAKLMEKNDIADGVDGAASATLTREQAAQYCLNALKADMVDYESKGTNVTINGAVIATGASKAKKVENTKEKDYRTTDGDKDEVMQLCEKLYSKLKLSDTSDAFDRTTKTWKLDTKKVSETVAEEAVKTYTAAVSGGTLYTDLGKPDTAAVTLYVDGVQAKHDTTNKKWTLHDGTGDKDYLGDFAIASGNKVKLGGNGTLVEVYETDTGKYTIIVVNTYVDTISKWTAAKKDANGDVTDKENVTLKTLNKTFETTDFTKQDQTDGTVVLVTVSYKNSNATKIAEKGTASVESVVKAEVVEDVAVTSYSSSKVNSYSASAKAKLPTKTSGSSTVVSFDMGGGATYDLYLDSYGYVIYATEAEAAENTDYVYALDVSTTDLGADLADVTVYRNVKYVNAAGETAVIKVIGKTSGGTTLYPEKNKWYTFEESDDYAGYYEYTAVTAKSGNADGLKKTTPTLVTGLVANNKTAFVLKTDKNTFKVYAGLNNLPAYTGTIAVSGVVKDSYAAVVYADVTASGVSADAETSSEAVYIIKANSGSNYDAATKTTYVTYTAIKGGELVKDLKVKSDTSYDLSTAERLVTLTTNSNGYVTAMPAYETVTSGSAPTKYAVQSGLSNKTIEYSEPTLTVDGKVYAVAADVPAYIYDIVDDEFTVGTAADLVSDKLASGQFYALYKSASDKTITALYFYGTLD